jgi:hypothetical protein
VLHLGKIVEVVDGVDKNKASTMLLLFEKLVDADELEN